MRIAGEGDISLTPLLTACLQNKPRITVELVKILIQCGANANCQDVIGNTPLHYSAFLDSREVLTYLLSVPNIQSNLPNAAGDTALELFINHSSDLSLGDPILQSFLKCRPAKITPASANRLLWRAIDARQLDLVQWLLGMKPPMDYNILGRAIEPKPDRPLLDALLAAGAHPSAECLTKALAIKDRQETAKLLVKAANFQTLWGAVEIGSEQVVSFLAETGFRPSSAETATLAKQASSKSKLSLLKPLLPRLPVDEQTLKIFIETGTAGHPCLQELLGERYKVLKTGLSKDNIYDLFIQATLYQKNLKLLNYLL